MALKHRKLYPSPTATNETKSCKEFCYPDCSYDCFPGYYYAPPPPPLPRFDGGPSHDSLTLQTIVIIFAVLFFFLVFICIAKAFMKKKTNPQSLERDIVSDEEGILNEVRVDNPIWYISTIGLQQSLINSISLCKYNKNEGLVEGTDCSVCLSEFQENETLRLLPKCSHAFHISCIDTWLRSHTNCPLCRSIIVTDSVVASEIPIRPSIGRENDDNEETRMEDSVRNTGGSGDSLEVTETEDEMRATHDGGERIAKEEEVEEEVVEERLGMTKVLMDSSSSENLAALNSTSHGFLFQCRISARFYDRKDDSGESIS